MADDDEWKKLPPDEKVVHKVNKISLIIHDSNLIFEKNLCWKVFF